MRIAIGSLIHETEPGAPVTMMEAFTLHREQAVLAALPAFVLTGTAIVPLIAAVSQAGGPLMRETFHVLAVELVHRLAARRPVDGVLLALSGGLAIEDESDGNAELLERVRNVLPPGLPIGVSLEAGALVTPRMRQPGVFFGGDRTAAMLLETRG
jgi:microcystin degradation protein MlrC